MSHPKLSSHSLSVLPFLGLGDSTRFRGGTGMGRKNSSTSGEIDGRSWNQKCSVRKRAAPRPLIKFAYSW